MARPEYLERNPIALNLEAQGLSYSLRYNQGAARFAYGDALDLIDHDPHTAHDSADWAAQRGSVRRNLGFTYVRDGIESGNEAHFQTAFTTIKAAIGETALYVSGAKEPNFQKDRSQLPHDTYKKSRRELLSEHAASLGLLARAATAAEVTLGTSTEETQSLSGHYGFAHDFARLGTNGYFRVSNAMNGARNERIAGRGIHAAVWVARAAFGVAWSAKNDPHGFLAAGRTFIKRLGDLRSQKIARESVHVRP